MHTEMLQGIRIRVCRNRNGGRLRIVYDQADRPVYYLEEDKKNGILRGQAYRYADTCALPWEQLYAKEDAVKLLNQRLMTCVSLSGCRDTGTADLICTERPCEVAQKTK